MEDEVYLNDAHDTKGKANRSNSWSSAWLLTRMPG